MKILFAILLGALFPKSFKSACTLGAAVDGCIIDSLAAQCFLYTDTNYFATNDGVAAPKLNGCVKCTTTGPSATSQGTCTACTDATLPPSTKYYCPSSAPTCDDLNCLECAAAAVCDKCSDGFYITNVFGCGACPAKCATCLSSGKCTSCKSRSLDK